MSPRTAHLADLDAATGLPICSACGEVHARATKGGFKPTCSGHRSSEVPGEVGPPCRNWPMAGSTTCAQRHGAGAAHRRAKAAGRVERANLERSLLERLADPPPLDHPVVELMAVAAEMKAGVAVFRERLAELQALHTFDSMGVEREKVVVNLYERAIDRFSRTLVEMGKLDLAVRHLALNQQVADEVMAATLRALRKAGLDDYEAPFRAHLASEFAALTARREQPQAALDAPSGKGPGGRPGVGSGL